MVSIYHPFHFRETIDAFFAVKPLTGPHAATLTAHIYTRAETLFENPDLRYMPVFKILDLLATMVNHAGAVSAESHLRAHEALALLRANLNDRAPLIRQFVLDAALERARYEPMMLLETADTLSPRERALHKRWHAMLAAHTALEPLPAEWTELLHQSVRTAMTAACFRQFRQGPLLQLFAEMLLQARQLHLEGASAETLAASLGEQGALWKRYALKSARYGEKPLTTPTPQARIPAPPLPKAPRIH